MYSDFILSTATNTLTQSDFWHIQNLVYSDIYRQIQVFLRDTRAYWAIINASPDIFIILCNPGILKTMSNFDDAYSKPSHSHNSLFRHLLDIFSDMQNLVKRLHIQIFRILEYSEPFHDCIPTNNQNPVIS